MIEDQDASFNDRLLADFDDIPGDYDAWGSRSAPATRQET